MTKNKISHEVKEEFQDIRFSKIGRLDSDEIRFISKRRDKLSNQLKIKETLTPYAERKAFLWREILELL
ncbi:MAG: hypothetical protein GXO89_14895 [Chlorobi bacterium]|nr:hypothetical protein [Chlorobiota bacterium]